MTEGLPFFPLLYPCVSESGNYLPSYYHTRVKSRPRLSLSARFNPALSSCFFYLRPVHSLLRCTHARYELVVRQSIAYVPCSPNFQRCCREWNCPGMYPLAVKISAHVLGPFGRFRCRSSQRQTTTDVLSNVPREISRRSFLRWEPISNATKRDGDSRKSEDQ